MGHFLGYNAGEVAQVNSATGMAFRLDGLMVHLLKNIFALVTLVAAILLADCLVNRANASCGDYALHSSHAPAANSNKSAAQHISRRLPDRSSPCPCKNGSCSRAPDQAPFRPTVRAISDYRSYCIATAAFDGDRAQCIAGVCACVGLQPIETDPLGLLRPPCV